MSAEAPTTIRNNLPTTVAAMFALSAFAVAVLAGMQSHASAGAVIVRALMAMLICYPIGLMAGFIAHKVIQDHLKYHRQKNPVDSEEFDVSVDSAGHSTDSTQAQMKQNAPNESSEEEILVV